MISKKIDAYTLMEVTVAMLLSAIVISICYTVYEIIGQYYQSFRHKNESIDIVLMLKNVLERDFDKSDIVVKSESNLRFFQATKSITYLFEKDAVIREVKELHADTFKVHGLTANFFFEGFQVIESDTIDRLELNIFLNEKQSTNIRIDKYYSAENLFK